MEDSAQENFRIHKALALQLFKKYLHPQTSMNKAVKALTQHDNLFTVGHQKGEAGHQIEGGK